MRTGLPKGIGAARHAVSVQIMPEIRYQSIDDLLSQGQFAPVYLIYGEAFLYKSAFEKLLGKLLPPNQRGLNYEPMEGADENVYDAIERLNTYSLVPGTKVIALSDSKIFYSKQNEKQLLQKAREAYANEAFQAAATYFAGLMGVRGLSFADSDEAIKQKIRSSSGTDADIEWIDPLIARCRDEGVAVPSDRGAAEALQKAVEKGFPTGHHLILTTDVVDKRRSLFKAVREHGVVIDCSVPKGARKADRTVQEAVLTDHMKSTLSRHRISADPGVFQSLQELTGFDLPTFAHNLDKLIDYAGQRKKITVDDVTAVLNRTKSDPIYALTNAVSDRNAGDALFFLDSLIANNIHPLQALAAVTNQMRRLMIARDFAESSQGKDWDAGCSYAFFQSHVIHAVLQFDETLLDLLAEWQATLQALSASGSTAADKSRDKKKKTADTDLVAARQPRNPFPIYQLLKKSENFKKSELVRCFDILSAADIRLKSTAQDPKLVLEDAILSICRPGRGKKPEGTGNAPGRRHHAEN